MIYPIVKYGDSVLERRGADISEFDTPELNKLIDDMFESMYAAKGVGLAAPQIGISQRIAVIDITSGEDPAQKIVLINPEIIKKEGSQSGEEGCLSIPEIRGKVPRARKISVTAWDRHGKRFALEATDFPARVIQHENDHLDGVLFFDRMKSFESLTYLEEYSRYHARHADDDDE